MADVVIFMPTRLRGMTIRGVVTMPTHFDLQRRLQPDDSTVDVPVGLGD